MSNVKNFLLGLLDWVYKKKCYFCGSSKECSKMCSKCYEELMMASIFNNREILGCNVYCSANYEKYMQKLIRAIKYHNQRELAFYQAKFMYQYWNKLEIEEDFQVVPVPLHQNRLKKRKYNHMVLVASEFCKLCGYELNTELISRVKDTKPQYKLTRSQRMENLKNAFEVNTKFLKNKPILILDDICTTGATFEAMIERENRVLEIIEKELMI